MSSGSTRRQGGATRLELAVALVLVTLLAGLLLERLISYQAETERVAAKQLVSSLRTALALRSAEAIVRGGDAGLRALAEQNPMGWLQKTPDNYLGEYYSAPKEALPSGHWYFDRSARTLVFLPSAHKSFSAGIQKVLIFKVELLRGPDPAGAIGRKGLTNGLVLNRMNEQLNEQLEDQSLALNNSAVLEPRRNFSEKN